MNIQIIVDNNNECYNLIDCGSDQSHDGDGASEWIATVYDHKYAVFIKNALENGLQFFTKKLAERRFADAELAGTNSCVDDERRALLFLKHRKVASDLQRKWVNGEQL
ncbi:MAG: hypothetical protein GY861_22160 [bacterium]|nr:hypothetical protein [bacterium]